MAVNLVELTADPQTIVDADPSDKVIFTVRTNTGGAIFDTTGGKVFLGSYSQTVKGNETFAATLPVTNGATNPTNFQYAVAINYVDAATRERKTWDSGWFSLTAAKTLREVVAEQYAPPTWMTTATATLQTYVDSGQAAATTASAAATTASGAADTAVNAAGLASEIALGDADAAFGAAQLNPASPLSVAQGDVLDDPTHPLTVGLTATFGRGVSVTDPRFGAVGDGTTDDTAAIQACIDYVAANGGGLVYIPKGVYLLTAALVLPSGIILQGAGHTATTLLKTGGGAGWMVESEDFATLSGSNLWKDSEGVPSALGLRDIRVYGGGNPPVAGADDRGGVRLYCRRPILERVMVHNVDGDGVTVECANSGGQFAWADMPEGKIDYLWVYRAGRDGFVFRGPHDNSNGHIFVSECYRDGAVFSRGATWSGVSEVHVLHSYANTRYGVNLDCPMHFDNLITESNGDAGLITDDAPNTKIGWLQAYTNNATAGTYQIDIGALSTRFAVGILQMTAAAQANIGGVRNAAQYVQMNNIDMQVNAGNTATGIENSAGYCTFKGVVRNFSGVGGKGLVAVGGAYSNYDLTIHTCSTFLDTTGDFSNSAFRIRGFTADTGATLWANAPTLAQRALCDIDYHVKLGSTTYSSKCRASATGLDIGTVGTYTLTIPHGLCFAPSLSDVRVNLSYAGVNQNWRTTPAYVTAVDATNITVVCNVTTAIGSPATQPLVQVAVDL